MSKKSNRVRKDIQSRIPTFARWVAGQSLAGRGFTATTSNQRAYFDEAGNYVVSSGAVRDNAWMRTRTGLWTNGLLIERNQLNLFPSLTPIKSGINNATAGITDVPARDGVGGFAKWMRMPGGGTQNSASHNIAALVANTPYTIIYVVEMEDGSAPRMSTAAFGVQTVDPNVDLSLVINNNLPVATVSAGISVRRIANTNRYLISMTRNSAADPVANGLNCGIYQYAGQSGKPFWFTCWHIAVGPPSMPYSGNRVGDLVTYDHGTTVPYSQTWYFEYLDGGSFYVPNTEFPYIFQQGSGNPRWDVTRSSNYINYSAEININPAFSNISDASFAGAHVNYDVVRHVVRLNAGPSVNGNIQHSKSINGGPWLDSAWSALVAIPANWQSSLMAFAGNPTGSNNNLLFRAIKGAKGLGYSNQQMAAA